MRLRTPLWKRLLWGSRLSPYQRGYNFGVDCPSQKELEKWIEYDDHFDRGSEFGRGMKQAYRDRKYAKQEDTG